MCEACGAPCKSPSARFCGYSCSNGGKNNPMFGKPWSSTHTSGRKYPDAECAYCSAVIHWRSRYCSSECRSAHTEQKSLSRTLERILRNDSHVSSGRVKAAVLRHGLLEAKCVGCGLEEWTSSFGTSSPLQLDHINGVNTDNRLENLRILCANCHTQTDTFCGKNIKKKSKK